MSRSKKKYERINQIVEKTGSYILRNKVARNRLYRLVTMSAAGQERK